MRNTSYLTKPFLIHHYLDLDKTVKTIAHEVGCSASKVQRHLITHEIVKTKPDKYIGKRFGRLVVDSLSLIRHGSSKCYFCRCDCGQTITVVGYSLRKNTKSCGCLKHRSGKDSDGFQGFGDIGLTEWSSILHSASIRNLEVNITIEDAWRLFLKQDKKCAYTGIILWFPGATVARRHEKGTASLDRVDSSKGYVHGNIQWVHKTVNIMKWHLGEEEFIDWCQRIANGPRAASITGALSA